MKVLALDYGSARTGVAVSDPTGTLARPLGVVERAATDAGLDALVELDRATRQPERVVVGLPLTLRGEHGEQARETGGSSRRCASAVDVPVETFDERFTSVARRTATTRRPPAHLLSSYLEWSSGARP